MSTDFIDTTARFTYLTPDEVADLDHPAVPTANGRAGLALGDEGAVILGTPAELRSWLHAVLPAALDAVPGPALDTTGSASRQHYIDTGTYLPTSDSPWWVGLDREHHDDLALGPYDNAHDAARDLHDGQAVDALCERDVVGADLIQDPTGRVLLHPDGTPHRPGDGYERTVLPRHDNDLGDWCPYSGTTARTDGACPQDCTAATHD